MTGENAFIPLSTSLLATSYFEAKVTGVCSTANLKLAKSLGTDRLIDYTSENFTQNSQTYDVIFDTVGKSSFSKCKNSLHQKGICLSTVITIPLLLQMLWIGLNRLFVTAELNGVIQVPRMALDEGRRLNFRRSCCYYG